MNFTPLNIIIILMIIVAVPYIASILKKTSQNFPFIKSLNPFYTKQMLEADVLKKNISPIMEEIETKKIANFIKFWSDKFENNRLTVQDVESLNAKIEAGESNQVNGILAVHPEGRNMFNAINADLKLKADALAAKTAAPAEPVLA